MAKDSAVPELPAPPPIPAAEELGKAGGYQAALDAYDRMLIALFLEQAGGSIREAARLIGMSRNGLRAKMRRLGLSVKTRAGPP